MAIKRQDIEVAQFNDIDIHINMLDANNNALDVSGFISLTWVVAESVRGVILITKSTTAGTLILPSSSSAVVRLTSAETGALTSRSLYHELRGVNSSGARQTMLAGRFIVQDTRISD